MGSRHLCERCDTIDITKLLERLLFKDKSLGTFGEVKQRSKYCEFCWLVVASLMEATFEKVRFQDAGKIKLGHKEAWELCVAQSTLDGPQRTGHWTNKYDLESYAREHPTQKKYCLMVKYEETNFKALGRIQFLVKGLKDEEDAAFLGRTVYRDQVHADLLKSWLDRCKHYHGSSCEHEGILASELPPGFRIIDLRERQIVSYPSNGAPYIALSYVWGGEKNWALTLRRHVHHDSRGSEVIELPESLPATLSDSMNLALHLGFRYMWIDSLCIVQDDVMDKGRQVGHMDAVYSTAALTIAAGSTPHADYGLHGLSIPRKYGQITARVQHLDLAIALPTFADMDDAAETVWNTRGWTFQEKIFSRRMLFFTDRQVYFKCNNAIWSEDVRMETKDFSNSYRRRASPLAWVADRIPAEEPTLAEAGLKETIKSYFVPTENAKRLGHIPNYMAVVSNYTSRELSYPEDVLKAIDGVLRTLELGKLYAGIPGNFFRFLLLWHPVELSSCTRSDVHLPSWTWAAYNFEGHCEWSLQLEKVFAQTRHVGGNMNMYADKPSDTHEEDQDGRYRVLTKHGWESVGDKSKREASPDPPNSPRYKHYLERCGTILKFKCERQDFLLGDACADAARSARRLCGYSYHDLTDKDGKCVGEVLIDGSFAQSSSPMKLSCLRLFRGKGMRRAKIHRSYHPIKHYYYPPQHCAKNNSDKASIPAHARDYTARPAHSGGEYSSKPFRNGHPGRPEYDTIPATWIIAHILIVEWVEPEIVRRVGIGRIILTAWEKGRQDLGLKEGFAKRNVYLI